MVDFLKGWKVPATCRANEGTIGKLPKVLRHVTKVFADAGGPVRSTGGAFNPIVDRLSNPSIARVRAPLKTS